MDAAVDEQQIAALLKGVDIPPRPAILVELEKELRKDSPSTNELVRLITSDVALSGHIMQVANSPAFAGVTVPVQANFKNTWPSSTLVA